jgi:hypothetical protein
VLIKGSTCRKCDITSILNYDFVSLDGTKCVRVCNPNANTDEYYEMPKRVGDIDSCILCGIK